MSRKRRLGASCRRTLTGFLPADDVVCSSGSAGYVIADSASVTHVGSSSGAIRFDVLALHTSAAPAVDACTPIAKPATASEKPSF